MIEGSKMVLATRGDSETSIALRLAPLAVVISSAAVAAKTARAVIGTPSRSGEIVSPLADILCRRHVETSVIRAAHAVEMLDTNAATNTTAVVDRVTGGDWSMHFDPSKAMSKLQDTVATDVAVAVVANPAFPKNAIERMICHS